jgi:hypothetical protein
MKAIILGLLFMFSVANAETILISSYKKDSMDYEEAYRIFSLRQTMWGNGTRVYVVMLPESHAASHEFITDTFGISPQRFARLQKLTGTKSVGRVIEVRTTQEAAEVISSKYGAIGYTNDKENTTSLFVIVIER